MASGESARVNHLVIALVAPKQKVAPSISSAPRLTTATPGRRIIKMPIMPNASEIQRPRFMRSPRNNTARKIPQIGIVNSIAATVANGNNEMPAIHKLWPAKWIRLRPRWTSRRWVRIWAQPLIDSTAASIATPMALRTNSIWKACISAPSSRTETAITTNETRAPIIQAIAFIGPLGCIGLVCTEKVRNGGARGAGQGGTAPPVAPEPASPGGYASSVKISGRVIMESAV